ncbi:MAG: hypothetical protein WDN50_01475 [Bradyrhizobium sp.]
MTGSTTATGVGVVRADPACWASTVGSTAELSSVLDVDVAVDLVLPLFDVPELPRDCWLAPEPAALLSWHRHYWHWHRKAVQNCRYCCCYCSGRYWQPGWTRHCSPALNCCWPGRRVVGVVGLSRRLLILLLLGRRGGVVGVIRRIVVDQRRKNVVSRQLIHPYLAYRHALEGHVRGDFCIDANHGRPLAMELPATDRYCLEISKDRASPISKKYPYISMIYFGDAQTAALRQRFLFCPAARFAVCGRQKRAPAKRRPCK